MLLFECYINCLHSVIHMVWINKNSIIEIFEFFSFKLECDPVDDILLSHFILCKPFEQVIKINLKKKSRNNLFYFNYLGLNMIIIMIKPNYSKIFWFLSPAKKKKNRQNKSLSNCSKISILILWLRFCFNENRT